MQGPNSASPRCDRSPHTCSDDPRDPDPKGTEVSKGITGANDSKLDISANKVPPKQSNYEQQEDGKKRSKSNSKKKAERSGPDYDANGAPPVPLLGISRRLREQIHEDLNVTIESLPTSLSRASVPGTSRPGAYNQVPGSGVQRLDSSILTTASHSELLGPNSRGLSELSLTGNSTLFTDREDGLAVANPVREDDLPVAEAHKNGRKETTGCNPTSFNCMIFLALAVCVVVLIPTLLLARAGGDVPTEEDTPPPSMPDMENVTIAPTENPSLVDVNDRLYKLLPNYTLWELQSPDSPQSLAYQWIIEDPKFQHYTDSRLVQRFALATLYYYTNGTNWYDSTNWLSYNDHECFWFARDITLEKAKNDPIFLYFAEEPSSLCSRDQSYSHLWLYNNNLEGRLPLELSLLTSLQSILLWTDQLEGSIPSELGLLSSSLEALVIVDAGLTGSIPSELGLLTNMKILSFSGNKLVGSIPSELGQLNSLEDLTLDRNGALTGTFPTELCALSRLQNLSFQRNMLTGNLPTQIGEMESLVSIVPGVNQFSGQLPSQLGRLTQLIGFYSYYNQLSGALPSQLGQMSALSDLALQNNRLTGTIPSELGLFDGLSILAVAGNQLSGSVPKELDLLATSGSLIALDLTGNALSGTISDVFCDIGFNVTCPYFYFECGLAFDCSENLCGCGCPCNATEVLANRSMGS